MPGCPLYLCHRVARSWLAHHLPRNQTDLAEKAEKLSSDIDSTIQTVRRIATELRPGILDHLGLAAALEWQAQEFQSRTGIRCRVSFQVLRLIASGKMVADIARELSLSVKTISTYRSRLLEKMGMKNNAELMHYAIQHRLVE